MRRHWSSRSETPSLLPQPPKWNHCMDGWQSIHCAAAAAAANEQIERSWPKKICLKLSYFVFSLSIDDCLQHKIISEQFSLNQWHFSVKQNNLWQWCKRECSSVKSKIISLTEFIAILFCAGYCFLLVYYYMIWSYHLEIFILLIRPLERSS